MKRRRIITGALAIVAACWMPLEAAAQGLTRQGRWYQYDGQYVWQAGIDFQSCASRKNYNYVATLDALQQARLNKIRIWAYCWFMADTAYAPWVYSNGKYDLDRWDSTYWSRMRDFVSKARARNIVVEFTIFAPYPSRSNATSWWHNPGYQLAWNKAYNVNGAFSSNSSNHFYPEFFDLGYGEQSNSGKTLQDYQQALVDKSVAELGGFQNVQFEIANEFPADFQNRGFIDRVYPWALHWARRVNNRTPRLVDACGHDSSGANVRGIQYFWNENTLDVLNFHFYNADPNTISGLVHNAHGKGKILQSNESFPYFDSRSELDKVTRESWGCFTSGLYYHYFHRDRDPDVFNTAAWRNSIQRLTVLRNVAESVKFWQMSPVDGSGNEYDPLVSQGPSGSNRQVLANPGSEYVAYFWGSRSTTAARISLPAGSYTYDWIDPRNGTVLRNGGVSGGGNTSVPAPATSGWNANSGLVLVLRATAASLPQVTVTSPDATASEPGTNTGSFRISRTGSTGSALGVVVRLSGSASEGTDYAPIGTLITIPSGASSRTVTLTPMDDAVVEGNETVVLDVQPNGAYQVGSPAQATVTINDDDSSSSNQPPVASGASITLPENSSTSIALSYTDPDGGPGPYVRTIVSPPSRGTLNGTGSTRTYTPSPGYVGSDSFTWSVNDGADESNVATVSITVIPTGGGTGLTGVYYASPDLSGPAGIIRTDAGIDFDWRTASPDPSLPADGFSVLWSGLVTPQYSETYTFFARTDDGVRLWVRGQRLIDAWVDQAATEWSGTVSLTAGQAVEIRMEYYENGGQAVAQLSWSSPSTPKGIVPQSQLTLLDTDGDGFPDAEEIALGSNPNNPSSFPGAGGGGATLIGGSEGREVCGATGFELILFLGLMGCLRWRRRSST